MINLFPVHKQSNNQWTDNFFLIFSTYKRPCNYEIPLVLFKMKLLHIVLKISAFLYVLPFYNHRTHKFYTIRYAQCFTAIIIFAKVIIHVINTFDGQFQIPLIRICYMYLRDMTMIIYLIYSCNVTACNNFLRTVRAIDSNLMRIFNIRVKISYYGALIRGLLLHFVLIFYLTLVYVKLYSRSPFFMPKLGNLLTFYYKIVLNHAVLCGNEILNVIEIYLKKLNDVIDGLAEIKPLETEEHLLEDKVRSLISLHNACDDLIRYFNKQYQELMFTFLLYCVIEICLQLHIFIQVTHISPGARIYLLYPGYIIIVSRNMN